ncbi:hypothetical protein [Brachyspira hampsonii]|uniref:Uncharacterized protein n=1 Tax=Brachyspira hampsonii TaxID=1287055 RepID=A0AAC9XK86_9SPIR|nr:hypothetical protein [Brachyspira hampsonii]ASJ21420.1 hypothetical protein BHAMNSH16_07090 [Brachyspira hampsonii]ELV05369.1 hypothetical protein H263_10709 [Brachyspira hampsonii 30599]MBW5379377.1 hypothetical protein [Brachyspira hampsonii]MBW5408787.1 hypothetical protein [Brachyspira hampsonii]OEJ19677.1 hypothetical protein A9496_03465 [Brachyspira hampsonii]
MSEKINTEEFKKIMADILEGYEKLENKQDLDTYLQEKLKEYEVGESEEERKSIISKFGTTLNGIADKFKSLINFKKKGKSTSQWLEQDLQESMKDLNEEDKSIIMAGVEYALKETQSKYINEYEKKN